MSRGYVARSRMTIQDELLDQLYQSIRHAKIAQADAGNRLEALIKAEERFNSLVRQYREVAYG